MESSLKNPVDEEITHGDSLSPFIFNFVMNELIKK